MECYRVIPVSGYATNWELQWVLRDDQGDLLAEGGQLKVFPTQRDIEQWARMQGNPRLLIIWPATIQVR